MLRRLKLWKRMQAERGQPANVKPQLISKRLPAQLNNTINPSTCASHASASHNCCTFPWTLDHLLASQTCPYLSHDYHILALHLFEASDVTRTQTRINAERRLRQRSDQQKNRDDVSSKVFESHGIWTCHPRINHKHSQAPRHIWKTVKVKSKLQ